MNDHNFNEAFKSLRRSRRFNKSCSEAKWFVELKSLLRISHSSNFTLTGLWLTPSYTGGSQDGVGGGGGGGGRGVERERGGGANVTQPPAEWLRITMGNGVSHLNVQAKCTVSIVTTFDKKGSAEVDSNSNPCLPRFNRHSWPLKSIDDFRK